MSQFDFESEIEILEEILSDLERAKQGSLESPYHKHLAESIDVDIEEINARLEELYHIQEMYWAEEKTYLNKEYERMVL
jgi:hypothetical protein